MIYEDNFVVERLHAQQITTDGTLTGTNGTNTTSQQSLDTSYYPPSSQPFSGRSMNFVP